MAAAVRQFVPARHRSIRDRWTPEAVLAALVRWHAQTGAVPRRRDWTGEHPGEASEAQRKWMREHPRWPSSTCVARHHGSWTAALEAAGLATRRMPGHTDLRWRVARARDLRAAGAAQGAIAEVLEVSVSTVRRYLAAEHCASCGGPVVDPAAVRCTACAATEPTVQRHWTRASSRQAMREWTRLHGSAPTFSDWTPSRARADRWRREWPRWPSATVVSHLWSDTPEPWNAALRDAAVQR